MRKDQDLHEEKALLKDLSHMSKDAIEVEVLRWDVPLTVVVLSHVPLLQPSPPSHTLKFPI